MVTSKKPSPNQSSPGDDDAASQPAADTAPYPETMDLADTQPFTSAQPYPEATQPLGVTEPRSPGDKSGVSGMTAQSFLGRHPLALGITAAALAVVVVAGLTAWGVGTAVAASYQTVGSAVVAPTASHLPVAGARKVAGHTIIRGEIAGIAGSSWTITTRAGATQHVTVGSATQYGTPKVPATASDFVVGTAVVVVEKSSDGSKSAVRVVAQRGAGKQPGATAAPGA